LSLAGCFPKRLAAARVLALKGGTGHLERSHLQRFDKRCTIAAALLPPEAH
jgi:hypothetical protein